MAIQDHDAMTEISRFLTLPELVLLGSTCKQLEEDCRTWIGSRMKDWKKKVERDMAASKKSGLIRGNFESLEEYEKAVARWKMVRKKSLTDKARYNAYTQGLKYFGEDINAMDVKMGIAFSGGPTFVTCLHVAAVTDDEQLCHMLIARGANVNANIFIPSNEDNQCQYDLITPLRLSITYGHQSTSQVLRSYGGTPGDAVLARLPVLPSPPYQSCCWASNDRSKIFYKNRRNIGVGELVDCTYVLFSRGDLFPNVLSLDLED